MRFGTGLRRGTVVRLNTALEQDRSIITPFEKLQEAEGVTEAYLLSLGLTHGDLLRLERHGFAIRGYRPGVNWQGAPDGFRKRWIVIGRDT